jgi:hypothetical protein
VSPKVTTGACKGDDGGGGNGTLEVIEKLLKGAN